MAGRGRPKKVQDEDTWAPAMRYYKRPERVEINTFAKRRQERLLAGYVALFKTVHGKDPDPIDMKLIYKITKGIEI
jgi:hypothetical protein